MAVKMSFIKLLRQVITQHLVADEISAEEDVFRSDCKVLGASVHSGCHVTSDDGHESASKILRPEVL